MTAEALSLRELQAFDPRARVNDGESDFCCPVCGEGKPKDAAHRCLSVNVRTGKYWCHRCEAKGVLAERQEPRPQLAPRERRRAALRQAFALPARESQEPADPSWRRHLRGLEALGGTPAASYLSGRGIPLALATAAGVKFSPRWYGRPAAVFAFRDHAGNLVAAQGRCTDGQEPGKLTAGPIGTGAFFAPGAREAFDAEPELAPIALVEAPIDALSLAVAGLPAIALGGKSGKRWLPRALAFRRVLLALDADEPGDTAAAQLAGELQSLGARCERLRPVGAKDWNELLQRDGAEALRAALAGVLLRANLPEADPAEEPGAWRYGPSGEPLAYPRCLRCLRVLPIGQSTCAGGCKLPAVSSVTAFPAPGPVAPPPAPAGVEYEPGADWPEAAPVTQPRPVDLVYGPGEAPAWCHACGVELVNPTARDGLCGPCRWQRSRPRRAATSTP